MDIKELWSLEIPNEVEEETKVEEVDKKTKETKTILKKEKVNHPDRLIFKRPSRREVEAAQEEYAVELSRCIKKGIVTKAMLAKRYRAEGGPLTDDEKDNMDMLYQRLEKLQEDLLMLRTASKKVDKEKESQLVSDITNLRRGIIEFENSYQILFQNTADSKAEVRAITWYLLNLLYLKRYEETEPKKIFTQNDLEEQIDAYYDKLDSTDPENVRLAEGFRKALTIASLLYYGGSTDPEEYAEAASLATT